MSATLEQQARWEWRRDAAQIHYRRCDGCDRLRTTVRKRKSRLRLCLDCWEARQ